MKTGASCKRPGQAVPGGPQAASGASIPRRTGAPAPPAATTAIVRDTPAGCGHPGASAGMGGRGLSHPQDGPLTAAGAFELQPGPGPCGQLGTRTANRMAVPQSPFIRERA